ncbi:MAG: PA2169 family four-helix-bundle protein [Bacteroidetes bacterium]|nr:PA2169 family four-helix-bundle protein [Bacteroidota bacterium]
MEKEKQIEVLNTLITINNDRIEGYETAAKETEEQDLKTLFAKFAATSKKCHQELAAEVAQLDGKVAEGTLISGKFFRVWMDVKAALTGKDRKAILNSCEYGEDEAVDTYTKALNFDAEHLSESQKAMIRAQKVMIKSQHDEVKHMRDSVDA